MDENRIGGAVKTGGGRIEGAAGALAGDTAMEARGKLNEAFGSAQQLYGRTVDQVRDAAGGAGELIAGQPVASVAIAAVVGIALGLLVGSAL
jgi:ElaB/YqjD/DUF883 family membrane-anchored ribosome-binding protein